MFGFNLTWSYYSQNIYEQFIYGTLCFKLYVLTIKIDVQIFMHEFLVFNLQFKIQIFKKEMEKNAFVHEKLFRNNEIPLRTIKRIVMMK